MQLSNVSRSELGSCNKYVRFLNLLDARIRSLSVPDVASHAASDIFSLKEMYNDFKDVFDNDDLSEVETAYSAAYSSFVSAYGLITYYHLARYCFFQAALCF